jgi:hypothetical protein
MRRYRLKIPLGAGLRFLPGHILSSFSSFFNTLIKDIGPVVLAGEVAGISALPFPTMQRLKVPLE